MLIPNIYSSDAMQMIANNFINQIWSIGDFGHLHLDKHELPVLSAKRAPAMGAEKKNPIHKSLKMRNIFGGNNSIYKLRGRKIYSGAQGCPTCFSLVPRKQSNNGNTKKIPNKTHTNKTTTVKQKKNPNKQNWKGNIFGACVPLSDLFIPCCPATIQEHQRK